MPQDTGSNVFYIDLNAVFRNVVKIVFLKNLKFIFV
jgi:hypothetical protein